MSVDLSSESSLTAAERTFRDIFNYSSDLIYIQNVDGTFIDVNQTVLDKYGYSKEEIIGKSPDFLGVPEKNSMARAGIAIKKAWDENTPQKFEWWALRKDGTQFLKEVVIRKGRYFDRDVLIATARDITERKAGENELKSRNQELKKLNSALDAFVYSASHDLKAPLSSMAGLLNLMAHDDPSKAGEYISRMQLSIEKLNQFIHDLVDYSRNAKMDLNIQKVKIKEKIKQIINELKYSEEAEKIMFDLQLSGPAEILSDSFRLRIILTNLISNAIRYHDKDKNKQYIIVKAYVKAGIFSLEVIDNGIGIGDEHKDKVFNMFYRANERNRNGSGLGLFMVREAVDMLNGEVFLESTLDLGTRVFVRIPLDKELTAIA